MKKKQRWYETRIRRYLTSSELQSRIIRGTSGSLVLRIGNTGLRFLASLLLAHFLSTDQLGSYNFAMAWLTLLIVPTLFGLDRLLIREFAKLRANQDWARMRGLLRWSLRLTFGLAIVMMVVAAAIAWLLYETTGRPALLKSDQADLAIPALQTLLIALTLLPLWALMLLHQSVLHGLRHIITGQLPEQTIRPLFFVIFIVGTFFLGTTAATPQHTVLLLLLATIFAFGFSVFLLNRLLPASMKTVDPLFEGRHWFAAALPLGVGRGLSTLNLQVDALMLGTLDSATAVALFTVAFQGTRLMTMLLISLNAALGPNLARLHSIGNVHALQNTMIRSARLVTAMTAPLCVLFIVGGKHYLRVFGPEFVAAYPPLTILAIGQLFNVMTGSVGILLNMTGHARSAMVGIAVGTGIHISLNVFLIPVWGIAGAAFAAAVSQVIVNLIQMALAVHHLGIHTSILGVLRLKKDSTP